MSAEPHSLGDLLLRNLLKALKMKDAHTGVNKKLDAIFSDEVREGWMQMIRNWEQDKSKPDPFTHTEKGRYTYANGVLQRLCPFSDQTGRNSSTIG